MNGDGELGDDLRYLGFSFARRAKRPVPDVTKLDDGLCRIDLNFQGMPGVIASYLLEDVGERALIETGPTSTIDSLLAGLEALSVDPASITKLLVTHIHLDHAGASGTLMRRFPGAHLYVHEIGAPHMIDPSRLLKSAVRIYGETLEPLWGAMEPVPEKRLTMLTDGDTITVGSLSLQAVYTPGHASHHVVFHDARRGHLFAGDVAAVRLPGFSYVRPATPPPDVDLEIWTQSLERIRALAPSVLHLTHFGSFSDVGWHLQETHDQLYEWAGLIERALNSGQDRVAIVDTLIQHGDRQLLKLTNEASVIERFELSAPYGMCVDGYLRYLQKQAEKTEQADRD